MSIRVASLAMAALVVVGCQNGPASMMEHAPITFSNSSSHETYDFANGRVTNGGHAGFIIADCSDEEFHCSVAFTTILAPKSCRVARAARVNDVWRTASGASARLIASRADGALYFESSPPPASLRNPDVRSGFVYLEDGVVAVWSLFGLDDVGPDQIDEVVRVLPPNAAYLRCSP